jgi:hypothetical protein
MVRGGYVRTLGASIGALVVALMLSAGPVLAEDSCVVEVEPASAVGGSVFTFNGSGFQPTRLELSKDGGSPAVNDIDTGAADPWQVTVQSRAGDEGSWTANFVADGGCSVSVDFTVGLASTDMVSDILGSQPAGVLPVLAYTLVIGFGLAGGMLLSRRLGDAQSGSRH